MGVNCDNECRKILSISCFYGASYLFSDPPRVVLKFGSNLEQENVLEGTDVYFDCIIDANPVVYKVEWMKNVSVISK